MMEKTQALFHGCPNPLYGTKLNPGQSEGSKERPENNLFGVYATDIKDLAIIMAMFNCEDVIGESIDGFANGKVQARIYGKFPSQEFVYLHTLPTKTFIATLRIPHQYISNTAVTPIKTQNIRVKDYQYLMRLAKDEETKAWLTKYGHKK